MPLSIPLPARAKVIINGAVIENSGSANITLTIHNKANILRDKDVLTDAEANTPAREVYHSIQNAYLFEANKDEWMSIARALLGGFESQWPRSAPIIAHVRDLLNEEKLYHALRASRRLIAFESGDLDDSESAQGGVRLHGGEGRGEHHRPTPRSATSHGPAETASRQEISRIRGQIAELERRIEALDPE